MYKEGDFVEIVNNTSNHKFSIGEQVQLIQATSDDLIASNGVFFWYISELDIKPIEK